MEQNITQPPQVAQPQEVVTPPPPIGSQEEQVTASVSFPLAHNHQRWNSLFVLPKEKSYENLEVDEKVIFFMYKHWIVLLKKIIVGGVLLLLPLIAVPLALIFHMANLWPLIVYSWYWYTFIVFYFLALLITYRCDIYIVTNERIIDFDLFNLLSKNVTEIDLEAIHNVEYQSGSGLLKGWLDYGEVLIEIPGKSLKFQDIAFPNKVALAVGELIEEYKKKKEVQPLADQNVTTQTPTPIPTATPTQNIPAQAAP